MKQTTSEPEGRSQADKFRDLARELECDEDEARFEDQVRKIASAPKVEAKEEQE